jgi:hypothetical protein
MGRTDRRRDDRGVALLLTLVTTALLTALAASLVIATSTETLISGSYRASQEAFYAADAALERAIHELSFLPDWTVVLAAPPSNVLASFDDGAPAATSPAGRSLSFVALTSDRQAASDAAGNFGVNRPVWRLYAHAPLQSVLPAGTIAAAAYVLLWIQDDGGDGDGDAGTDSNGVVVVCAEAYGPAGARRRVEATIGRVGPGAVRVLAWRDER